MRTRYPTIDPLGAFLEAKAPRDAGMPLVSTRIDVDIRHGVVVVETERLFRNSEERPIEATMTFPVPVHATLHALEVRIGERTLVGHIARASQARQDYEDALDDGRLSVLHEEVLKGLHMLSVGPVPPGQKIVVGLSWVSTLEIDGTKGRLRIPTTLGDVYGRSTIADSDAPIHARRVDRADLVVRCTGGHVSLRDGGLEDGQTTVMLDAPIDLTIEGVLPGEVSGRAADGRSVRLAMRPVDRSGTEMDAAILVDHSGSMDGSADGTRALTKHACVVRGLSDLAADLRADDSIDLWQFSCEAVRIGRACGADPEADLRRLARRLDGPGGGTEIGGALEAVIEAGHRSVLLLTDGKSWALDVPELSRRGCRISVVLIGEDSLDGDISQLAVLTGGDVHIATGAEIRSCLRAGIQDFRHPASWPRKLPDHDGTRVTRRGMDITITRGAPAAEVEDHRFARAVGALSAGLALPGMAPDAAAELAEAEGLVTHLTSLVMVDDAGERCDGFPVTRKIPLATPRDIMSIEIKARRRLRDPSRSRMLRSFASGDKEVRRDTDPLDQGNLATWGASIDWQTEGSRLIEGDLSGLPALQVIFLEKMARHPRLIEAAGELGMDALLVLIGLIARTRSTSDRTAKRVANRLLGENAVSGVSV